ncbi:MAG: hypothetical protein Q8O67_29670 [Deltaproteobacteria bacterium]|nr:hypothetical protein [Deltaproteobacteria bacterium]
MLGRLLVVLLCLGFFAQASGVAEVLQACGDCDDDDDGCAPTCTSCDCSAPRLPPVVLVLVPVSAPLVVDPPCEARVIFAERARCPRGGFVDGVMHVPIATG